MGHLLAKHWAQILDADSPDTYVETGLWKGEQIALALPRFNRIVGIELAPQWVKHCRRRFADEKNVEIIAGDSAVELPKVLDRFFDVPLVVKLDAHQCGGAHTNTTASGAFPLWTELELLARREVGDIVIVDDVHTFGRHRSDLPDPWHEVTVASVTDIVSGRHAIVGDGLVIWRDRC